MQKMSSLRIKNVHLPFDDPRDEQTLYTVFCKDGKVDKVVALNEANAEACNHDTGGGDVEVLDGKGGLLLPS